MKYYSFDKFGFYNGSREAQEDPRNPDEFLGCGKFETAKTPLLEITGKANHWTGIKWELVDNQRGKQIWNTNNPGETKLIDADNVLSEGWTLLEYQKYHKWSGSAWIVDTDKKQIVIAVLAARIDNEMETKILNDFEFSGKMFYLDDKNQFKYKAEYDIRENLTYPHRVKCVNGYYDIQTVEEHQGWYLGGLQFVRACEVAAWNEIDALQNKTTAELIELLNT